MDLALIIIGILLIFLGLIGSFIPVIPGPITAWVALFPILIALKMTTPVLELRYQLDLI